MNLWLALGIATAKATLVLLYFMHLRYDAPVNAIVFVVALLFLALFVGLALLDTTTYQPDLIPNYAPGIK
jgi:cytochrome c oxidase subunit 4